MWPVFGGMGGGSWQRWGNTAQVENRVEKHHRACDCKWEPQRTARKWGREKRWERLDEEAQPRLRQKVRSGLSRLICPISRFLSGSLPPTVRP